MSYTLFIKAIQNTQSTHTDLLEDITLPNGHRQTLWGLHLATTEHPRFLRRPIRRHFYAEVETTFDTNGEHLYTRTGKQVIFGDMHQALKNITEILETQTETQNGYSSMVTYTKEER